MNYCEKGGYLVDEAGTLASDVTDYQAPGLPLVGCTHLRCPACDTDVRSVPRRGIAGPVSTASLTELYAQPDLSQASQLVERAGQRLYLCRCAHWSQSQSSSYLLDADPDPITTPRVRWRCAGHPVVALPHAIDGRVITPDNLGDIARQALHGTFPPDTADRNKWGGTWLARLHARLAQTAWGDAVVTAAITALADGPAETRMRALHFLHLREIPGTAERALAILAGDRTGYAGIADAVMSQIHQGRTLEHTLWYLASPLLATSGAALDLARRDALSSGGASFPLYAALASSDPDWLVEHLDALLRANPDGKSLLTRAVRARLPARIAKKPLLDKLGAKA